MRVRSKKKLISLFGICAVFISASIYLLITVVIVPAALNLQCGLKLGDIFSGTFDWSAPDGERFFFEFENIDKNVVPGWGKAWNSFNCPACGDRYAYRPITPSGKRVQQSPWNHVTVIMWCPEPCHNGERNFLHADGHTSKDNEISFYFQKALETPRNKEVLSDEEIQRENAYRKARGLPMLKKRENRD